MAVSIVGGKEPLRRTGWRARETLTQSTATSFQSVSIRIPLTILGVGTATGSTVNLYSLASGGIEGQEKSFLVTGTGEAKLFISGTATGLHVFTAADDYILAKYDNGSWRIIVSSATLSTGT